MTLKTLSRITSILSQLETFKVRELAITTLILSSVRLGMLPVGQLPMTITTMSQFTVILFQLDTNEVRQLAVTE